MSDTHRVGAEPTIPSPPTFVGTETRMQDSAKSRVVMITTEYDGRRTPADVTDVWDAVLAERDRMRRLFNRLEAAVSHHKKALGYEHDDLHEPWDEALYKARDKILKDYADGNG